MTFQAKAKKMRRLLPGQMKGMYGPPLSHQHPPHLAAYEVLDTAREVAATVDQLWELLDAAEVSIRADATMTGDARRDLLSTIDTARSHEKALDALVTAVQSAYRRARQSLRDVLNQNGPFKIGDKVHTPADGVRVVRDIVVCDGEARYSVDGTLYEASELDALAAVEQLGGLVDAP